MTQKKARKTSVGETSRVGPKPKPPRAIVPLERIERCILLMRSEKVMLDADLAGLYDVETKMLVRAMRRNIDRFPGDFMFQLTKAEFDNLRCQSGTSSS